MPGYNAIGSLASGASTGAAVGGPWGAAIGAGAGLLLGGLGSIFGGGHQDFGDVYGEMLQGIPGLSPYGDFNPVGLPGLVGFERFGASNVAEAQGYLRPQLQLAIANQRRGLAAANTASGAGVAAGGLSPAAAAAMASRNALNAGIERTGLETGFAGAGIDLAGQISSQRLAASQAEQAARFGRFDRAFQQATYGSEFERQQAIDAFRAELERRGLAGDLAGAEVGNERGDFWDFLGGFGSNLAGAGAQGMSFDWLMRSLGRYGGGG